MKYRSQSVMETIHWICNGKIQDDNGIDEEKTGMDGWGISKQIQ
jgi:hypothetical protein